MFSNSLDVSIARLYTVNMEIIIFASNTFDLDVFRIIIKYILIQTRRVFYSSSTKDEAEQLFNLSRRYLSAKASIHNALSVSITAGYYSIMAER